MFCSLCIFEETNAAGTTCGLGVAHATPPLFIDFVSQFVLMFYAYKSICMLHTVQISYYKSKPENILPFFCIILSAFVFVVSAPPRGCIKLL